MTPQFDSLAAFFAMGGYGFFVWLSFGVSLAVMLVLVVHTKIVSKKIRQHVIKETERAQRILAARAKRKAR